MSLNKPYISSTQVASSVPYDNTTDALNAFTTTDVQATIDELMSMQYMRLRDDFMIDNGSGLIGDINWQVILGGSATILIDSTNVTSNHPGIARLTASGILGGSAAIGTTDQSVPGTNKVGGGQLVFEFLIFLNGLSTAANEYTLRLGLGDSPGSDFTNGIYFQYTRTTSVNWLIKTANAATRTSTTTTTAVTASAWTKLRVVVNAAGTSAQYFINGTSVGTISTNIPTAASQFYMHVVRSAGTPAAVDIDYFTAFQAFTTNR